MTSNSSTSTPFFISGLSSMVIRHNALITSSSNNDLTINGGEESATLSTSTRRLEFPELDPARSIAIAFPLILIVLCTVCGNFLVLLAVITTRKLRTATNYFIVNLAIADMMLGVTVLPFSTTIEILDEFWIFGQALCDMWVTVDVLCCTASIYGLCVISVDRYIGVSKPLAHHQIVNKRRAILINLGVWILSACICVVPFFGWRKSLSVEASGRCEVNEDRAYVIFSATCSFFLPCTIVIIVYWRIYLKAIQQTRFMKLGYKEAKLTSKSGENGVMLRIHTGAAMTNSCGLAPPNMSGGHLQLKPSFSKRDSTASTELVQQQLDTNLRQRKIDWTKFKRERRAARTLGIVVGVFIACWVPFFVILPTNAFCECLPPQLFKVVFWLGYCNSLMNPFIYGADSREFQAAFKRLLCGRKSGYPSQAGTPRCASSIITRARRQMMATAKHRNNLLSGTTTEYNNGTTSTFLKPSTLPTAHEEDNEESLASVDALSSTVVMKTAKSNNSLNRSMLNIGNNGLLTVPVSTSCGVNQPLLADFNEQNYSVETKLVDSAGGNNNSNATVTVSRPSPTRENGGDFDGSSPARSHRGVVSSSPSLANKTSSTRPLFSAGDLEMEAEAPLALVANSTTLSSSRSPLNKLKNSFNKQDGERPSIGEQIVFNKQQNSPNSPMTRSPIVGARGRVMSISSLSTLSSPSDSDDEELKNRKRASRENRPKKHFIKSQNIRRVSFAKTTRRLQFLKKGQSIGTNEPSESETMTLPSWFQQSTSSALQTASKIVITSKDKENSSILNKPDDLASLAFRRLLMVRFARRVRAKSKAARDVADQGDREQTPEASGDHGDGSGHRSSTSQSIAPQSRWRAALAKIALTTQPSNSSSNKSPSIPAFRAVTGKSTSNSSGTKALGVLSNATTSVTAAVASQSNDIKKSTSIASSPSILLHLTAKQGQAPLPNGGSSGSTSKDETNFIAEITRQPVISCNSNNNNNANDDRHGSLSLANSNSVFVANNNSPMTSVPPPISPLKMIDQSTIDSTTSRSSDRCILELEENSVEL